MTQNDQARAFAALHIPGDPLILFNAWDAGSATAIAEAGAKAIATSSSSVAMANGFPDGEAVPMDFALANADRIVQSVGLPVTVDFEGGYAVAPEAVAANAKRLAATGVVGCNFEDQVVGGEGLHSIDYQSHRIRALRDAVGPDLFINLRTDLFLKADASAHDATLADAAIERGRAYADAGVSGFFIPGLGDLTLVERICKAVPLPVNAMHFPGAPNREQWASAGIARISYGPFPHMDLMAALTSMAREAIS
ncbi:isocitrate lyase/PEP mutase family protein [Sphingomonas alba]|uniref:Isocitrate lyase/phosphoenolpyruvate mutase family protein n=1 Tax=Sphingomonas alba TaxID=2908208 RepID=A0ABT0RNG6_9SPHN|nr:isocitrate lyase/phosphoenolpyruvate mutase family protein [Sphingomonas alba]MCL6684060.1 isocitrate lyase/phosphoenolpyruvate mutase family protein [Sphingomonas alba]